MFQGSGTGISGCHDSTAQRALSVEALAGEALGGRFDEDRPRERPNRRAAVTLDPSHGWPVVLDLASTIADDHRNRTVWTGFSRR